MANCTNCLAPNPDPLFTSFFCLLFVHIYLKHKQSMDTHKSEFVFLNTCRNAGAGVKCQRVCYVTTNLAPGTACGSSPKGSRHGVSISNTIARTVACCFQNGEWQSATLQQHQTWSIIQQHILSQSLGLCFACGPQGTMNCLSVLQQINFLFPEEVCLKN